MKLLEEGLSAFIKQQATIVNIIGSKIYAVLAPDDAVLPYIIYSRISGSREHIMSAISGLAMPVMQLSCYAATYAESKQLAESVRLSLDNHSGDMGGVNVQAVLFDNEVDDVEESPETRSGRSFIVHADYQIWHDEAIS